MTLAIWKRTVLAGIVALSVAGASLTTFSAGSASADTPIGSCYGPKVNSGRPCSTV